MTAGPKTPVILGFDTSGPYCTAAVMAADGAVTTRFEDMAKGQAERLMVLLSELMADVGLAWSDLDALAVGVGPGNFTGIRISVSAVRGLALGLRIPVISVTNFEIARGAGSQGNMGADLVALPAPRGACYVQRFEGGQAHGLPELQSEPHDMAPAPVTADASIAEVLVRIAAAKWHAGLVDGRRPKPLYIKPPDAAPARHAAPTVVG